jgi:hypothetical protein
VHFQAVSCGKGLGLGKLCGIEVQRTAFWSEGHAGMVCHRKACSLLCNVDHEQCPFDLRGPLSFM